jgi:hypothetical protein
MQINWPATNITSNIVGNNNANANHMKNEDDEDLYD